MNQPLAPYPDYKPAGLPWLAQVPAHWDEVSIRAITQVRNERGRADLELLSVYREFGVIRKASRDDNHNADGADLSAYKVVKPGYLVLNKMKTWQGSLGISQYEGIVSPAYIVCAVTRPGIELKYLNLLLRSRPYVHTYNRISFGVRVGQWDMRYDDFKQIKVLLPPLAEQQQIVAFLDAKGRQVARLLRAKRQLIKLLQEQKQALIHRAVTQGLNPDAPRKESGVAWLGAVPAHWVVTSIGRLARVGNGSTPSRATPEYWQGGDYPWLNSSHANRDLIDTADQFVTKKALAECHLPKVPVGSVLVAITGQGKTRGKAALLEIEATINQHIAYITPSQQVSPEYLQLFLTAAYSTLRSISDDSGSTKGALTCADLKRFKIAFPNLTEQTQVVKHLAKETHLLDETIARAQREIELIQEYRTRLVADVVTGRVDVRGLAVAAGGPGEAGLEALDEEDAGEESETLLLEEADAD